VVVRTTSHATSRWLDLERAAGSTLAAWRKNRHRPEAIRAECEASLRRLGREAIDVYQLHGGAHTAAEAEPVVATLDELVAVRRGHPGHRGRPRGDGVPQPAEGDARRQVDGGQLVSLSGTDVLPGFFAGKYRMIMAGNYVATQINEKAPEGFQWTMLPLLKGTGQA
jgi:hypothetical protein